MKKIKQSIMALAILMMGANLAEAQIKDNAIDYYELQSIGVP